MVDFFYPVFILISLNQDLYWVLVFFWWRFPADLYVGGSCVLNRDEFYLFVTLNKIFQWMVKYCENRINAGKNELVTKFFLYLTLM